MSEGLTGSGVEGGSDAPDSDRNLLEVCCEDNSALGQCTAESKGCEILRITEKRDLLKDRTFNESVRFIRKDGCTLAWVAIPCTGGSVLQFANRHHPNAQKRLGEHLRKFRLLWKRAVELMTAVMKSGGLVVIEWPTSCLYWHYRDVKRFLRDNQFHTVNIHGCAFGMRNKDGDIVLKPWKIASSSATVTTGLDSYKCTKDHPHAELHGGHTTRSSSYSPRMAAKVHQLFNQYCDDKVWEEQRPDRPHFQKRTKRSSAA